MKKLLVCWILIPVICSSQELKNIPLLIAPIDTITHSPTVREIHEGLMELMSNPDTLLNHDKKVAQRWYAYEFPKYNVKDSNVYDIEPYLQAMKAIHNSPLNCGAEDPSNWISDGPIMPHVGGTGQQWGGWVSAIYQKPSNTDTILAGTRMSGIFRTTNEGGSWVCVTDELSFPVIGVRQLIGNPYNENHVLAITGTHYVEGGAIYSTDAGVTWNEVTQTLPQFNWVGFHKSISGLVFAVSDKAVYFSTDSGLTWEEFESYPELTQYYDFYKVWVLDDKLFVNTKYNQGSESWLYQCDFTFEDDELDYTWSGNIAPTFASEASSEIIAEHLISFTDFSNEVDGRLYLQVQFKLTDTIPSPLFNTLFKSIDAGDNFSYLENVILNHNIGTSNDLGGFHKNELIASLHNPNVFYWGSIRNMRRYNDTTGVKTAITGLGHHDDYRFSHIVSQGNTDRIIFGNDGGVGLVEDGLNSPTIISKNSNLSINLLHAFDVHEKTGRVLYAFQDHRMRYKNSDDTYYNGGFLNEGSSALVQQYHPNDMVGESAYSGIWDLTGSSNPLVDVSGGAFGNGRCYLEGRFISYRHYPERFARGLQHKDSIINYGGVAMNRAALVSEVSEITESNAIGPIAICERYPHHLFAGEREPGDQATKLFKSVDDGENWISLTNSTVSLDNGAFVDTLSKLLHWNVVRSIAMHHVDTNVIYCGIGGTHTLNGVVTDELFRVIKSTNGGATFVDYSEGLPALPVERLLTVESDNELIFCGTSVGVYYRTNEMSQWECFSQNLPKVMITGMKYVYCEDELYVSTFGRGIWKTKVNLRKNNYAQEITSTTTWDEPKHLIDNILVKSGSILTITDTVEINGGIKIMIEPGAKLVVDGGTLTKYCNARWQGIQVYGQSGLHQTTANQGILVTKNDAVIEFANQAVEVWKKDVWNTMGGMVNLENTTFRNNGKSIAFFPYANIIPSGSELQNYSSIFNCNFIVDDDFVGDNPVTQVTLFKVKGITIQRSHFEDLRTGISPADRMSGIRSLDATFKVMGVCPFGQPCDADYYDEAEIVPTTFKNLSFGIHAQNAQAMSQATIDRCYFEDVHKGVVIDAMDNAIVSRNLFDNEVYRAANIITQGATAYKIEGNTFRGYDVEDNISGVQVYHSGGLLNQVFRNRYETVSIGNISVGVNRDLMSSTAAENTGLQFLCNTYETNEVDQLTAAVITDVTGEGMQDWQGTPQVSAGNTFDDTEHKSIINAAENQSMFRYFYFENNANEEPINSAEIMMGTSSDEHECKSTFSLIVVRPTKPILGDKRPGVLNDLDSIIGVISVKSALLDSLLRLGDTSLLYTQIPLINSDNSAYAFAQLSGAAPYLSEGVLYLLADVNPSQFVHAYLRDICILHPEVSRQPDFIDYLENKTVPMPSVMIDSILNSPEFSGLSTQRAAIRLLNEQKELLSTLLIQDYFTDSIYPSLGALDTAVIQRGHAMLPLELVQTAIWKQDRSTALQAISDASDWLDTTDFHILYEMAITDYLDFQTDVLDLTSGVYLEGVDSIAEVMLREYAENAVGYAQFQAENYLCFFLNECDIPHYEYVAPKGMLYDDSSEEEEWMELINEGNTVSLYPNPATEEVTLDFGEEAEKALFVVFNAQGQLIADGRARDTSTHKISTADWQPGLYLIRVRVDNNKNETLRLIVK